MTTQLVREMKRKVSKGSDLVNFLMDILSMGKEAVYRRLRGEVAFTFDEVALISQKMNISLDQIAGNSFATGVLCDLTVPHKGNLMEEYYEALLRIYKLLDSLKDDPSASIIMASNMIPYLLFSDYENLIKYRFCRWYYHRERIMTPRELPETIIPDKIKHLHTKLNNALRRIKKTCFIWDKDIFLSFINEIKYFVELRLIMPPDLIPMKEELKIFLDELEILSLKGKYETGNNVYIYLSNINFESSYTYLEKSDFKMSLLGVFSINSLSTQSETVCDAQKKWIDSLKRHSMLISQSGEMQRINFFNEQRKLVNTL